MLILKMLRKLGKLLRGGACGREIFLGGFIGVVVGMIPGLNLALLLSILVLLLLNANVGIAALGIALGKVCCLLLAPVTFQIGYALIHQVGLEGLFRTLAETPVLALMDLHVYCLIGGLPLALVLGLAFGWVMVRVINGLRLGIVEATTRSEKMQKLAQNKIVRLVLWLVFGKQKDDMADLLMKNPPLMRKSGLILVATVVVVVLALEFLLLNLVVKIGLTSALSAATGAEVNLVKAKMSLLAGKLELQGLQVTDPDTPTQNLVEADGLTADLSVADLLAKRYVVDLLAANNVRLGAARATPGKVYKKAKKDEEQEKEKEPADAVTRYFDKAKDLKKHLKKVKEYLDKRKAKQAAEKQQEQKAKDVQKEQVKELAATTGYLALSAKSVIADRPTWVIRKVDVDGLVVKEGAEPQKLEAAEVSSHPELHPQLMTMTLSPAKGGDPSARLEFHFEKPNAMHLLKVNMRDVALGEGLKLSSDVPLDVQEGTVNIDADGQFSDERLELPFNLVVRNLKANTQEGKSVLGLDPKTAQEVFRNLDELKIAGTIQGSLTAPTLKLDQKQILASLKEALMKAGKAELARRANEQLQRVGGEATKKLEKALGGKLGVKVPVDVKKTLKDKLPGGLGVKIPGLGAKGQKEEGKKPQTEEKKKPQPKDLLKKLF